MDVYHIILKATFVIVYAVVVSVVVRIDVKRHFLQDCTGFSITRIGSIPVRRCCGFCRSFVLDIVGIIINPPLLYVGNILSRFLNRMLRGSNVISSDSYTSMTFRLK